MQKKHMSKHGAKEHFKGTFQANITINSRKISKTGIFGGNLENPVAESTKQCCRAYKKFINDFPDYFIDVKLCAFTSGELQKAEEEFAKH